MAAGFGPIAGLRVGHAHDDRVLTGCTVLLAEAGMVAGCDVRGGAVGERELTTIQPGHLVERIHALVFAGGPDVELIEVFERIFEAEPGRPAQSGRAARPQYHFVILDYLCEAVSGEPRAGGDVTDLAFVREAELGRYNLTPAATRVLRKAFAMARAAK